MIRSLILLLTITTFFIGCTQKNTENNANTAINYQLLDTLMTVEKYADMDFELASMLFENYYNNFKDKKYEEVKDLYSNFLSDKDSIYKKYGVADARKNYVWARKHKVELKAYREAHPEINYLKKYPDFKDANIVLYNLARSEYNSKQTKE